MPSAQSSEFRLILLAGLAALALAAGAARLNAQAGGDAEQLPADSPASEAGARVPEAAVSAPEAPSSAAADALADALSGAATEAPPETPAATPAEVLPTAPPPGTVEASPPPPALSGPPDESPPGAGAPVAVGDSTTAAGPEAAAQDGSAGAGLPHDLSPVGMFRAADRVVQAVMIALALASVLTWTVFVVKVVEIAVANRRARRASRILAGAASLAEAHAATSRSAGPAAWMIRASAEEYARSLPAVATAGTAGLKERIASLLGRAVAQAGRRLQRGTGILASIGSVAPFVGLLGTVWGIMNAFIGISRSQTTNLAVVAPGIAEALLATALGLVAAIPAVIIYNLFARAVTGYRQNLADAAAGIERLVSRDLDLRAGRAGQTRPARPAAG